MKHSLVVEPTHLKNMSQMGNLPQVGVKIKNIWVATTQNTNWSGFHQKLISQEFQHMKPPVVPSPDICSWDVVSLSSQRSSPARRANLQLRRVSWDIAIHIVNSPRPIYRSQLSTSKLPNPPNWRHNIRVQTDLSFLKGVWFWNPGGLFEQKMKIYGVMI